MRKLLMAMGIAAVLLIHTSVTFGGTLTGEVTYAGEIPPPTDLKITTDPFCIHAAKGRTTEDLVVSQQNGIQNVVIALRRVSGDFKPPAQEPVLDQAGCVYTPHVTAVLTGTTVNIHTSDQTLHNVHAHAKKNDEVNWAMPVKNMTLPYKTIAAEVVKLTCDVHKWMNAYIVVLDNPFFAVIGAKDDAGKTISASDFRASQSKGSYRIENIPPGTYRVQAWHETLGVANAKVDIPETGDLPLKFTSDQFKKRGKK